MQLRRQLARRLQVVAERLLDDDPLSVRHELRVGQALDHRGEQRWRDLEIEDRVVAVAKCLRHVCICLRVTEIAAGRS